MTACPGASITNGRAWLVIAFPLELMLALALTCACSVPRPSPTESAYDLVILGGRVMDPASGLDAVRSVGITGGTIRAVSAQPLRGRDTLDARGMVVAPGFIDLHQHAQDPAGYRVEVLDGTTTALELEGGTVDVDRWYDERAGTSIINHGVSVGHDSSPDEGHGRPREGHAGGSGADRAPARKRSWRRSWRNWIVDFGAARSQPGMLIEFTPGATPWEVVEVFRVAASHGAAVHVHHAGLAGARTTSWRPRR